ncbi:phosphonate metabolism transcriptional regulator PhnF [Paraburkholderia sp. J94]|uniref:phosphonate metabolism transcriptional regulator PhnF n=1 Tax=Paraburkholderia sp. J94 TaxID=2805441 RepID=UPI002AB033A7|nr:phosphonate metabolism transcriptional regulator PhnF [Paraburkholderia sp. J94]
MDSNDLIQPRRKGTSIWKQIETSLLSEIATGAIAPGERLPSECALAERFNVNRHTVRRALAELSAQDYVQIENGRGAFVTERALSYKIDKRTRSLESMVRSGHNMVVKVLKFARIAAEPEIALALAVTPGADVWVIDSLSTIDKKPAISARHSFPADRFPDLLTRYRKARSISATLKTYGVESTRKSMVVSAKLAQPEDLKLLKLSWPAPVLSTESLYIDQDGKPVDHGVARYAGDRMELQFD